MHATPASPLSHLPSSPFSLFVCLFVCFWCRLSHSLGPGARLAGQQMSGIPLPLLRVGTLDAYHHASIVHQCWGSDSLCFTLGAMSPDPLCSVNCFSLINEMGISPVVLYYLYLHDMSFTLNFGDWVLYFRKCDHFSVIWVASVFTVCFLLDLW